MQYKIEGGFDFYSALKTEDKEEEKEDDTNICLITRMPLMVDFVQMECGHKFNYLPLYNDLVQHTKPSLSGVLRSGCIACPFCRRSQSTLLPYNERFKLVIGVNLYPLKMCKDASAIMVPKSVCEFASLNVCTSEYTYKLSCGKHYCVTHKILGMSIAVQEMNHSAFLLKKEKLDKKLLDKLAKLAKKQQAKEAKDKGQQDKGQQDKVESGCIQLVKSGPRKGQVCGCKKTVEVGFCGRHKHKEFINLD
jgi:hypothetical protein